MDRLATEAETEESSVAAIDVSGFSAGQLTRVAEGHSEEN